jgi:putative ABC transport system permease protein
MWSALLVLAVMFAAASATSAKRSGAGRSGVWLALAIAAGVGATLPIMLITTVLPLAPAALVPVGGILMGNTMAAVSQAAQRGLRELKERHEEVEGGLALGMTDRQARIDIVREGATDALHPGVDQTKTVGLVALPGAFVGVLLATGSPVQAGAAQLLVLVGQITAQALGVLVTIELVARVKIWTAPERELRISWLRARKPRAGAVSKGGRWWRFGAPVRAR